MENYDNLFKSICRVCLSIGDGDNMISLFDNTTADGLSSYGKAVMTFANIFLESNDNLPNLICESCIFLLKQGISFKLKCELTDRRLKRFWNMKNSNGNLKSNICQYIMFGHYFPEEYDSNENIKIKDCRQLDGEENHDEIIAINDFEDCFSENNCYGDHCIDGEENCDKILEIMEEIIKTDFIVYDNQIEVQNNCSETKPINRKQRRRKRDKSKTFVCKVCHKVIATKPGYNSHIQKHYGWRFVCDICGKGCRSNSELQLHQVEKHAIGPYLQCDHCNFRTTRKFLIIEHMRIHTGERPFTCEKCNLSFRREYIWKKHLIKHADKNHQCPRCPKKFFMRCQMLEHMNNIHERIYVFLCYVCGATYAQRNTVREHLIKTHNVSREMQGKVIKVKKEESFILKRRRICKEANCNDSEKKA